MSLAARCMRSPRRFVAARSAEEPVKPAEGDGPEDIPTESGPASEAESSVEEPSPIEMARMVLAADSVDKAALEAALAQLDAQMAALQESAADAEARAEKGESNAASLKDQLLRLTADFENFRRRTKDERTQLANDVRGDIVISLLPVVDNFELARTQVKCETEGEEKVNGSYQNLYKQFVEFLRALGVEAVPSVGSEFNPEYHEAIMKEENLEVPDNTVLQEFRKGFMLKEKLLRAAMVKVSEGGQAREVGVENAEGGEAAPEVPPPVTDSEPEEPRST